METKQDLVLNSSSDQFQRVNSSSMAMNQSGDSDTTEHDHIHYQEGIAMYKPKQTVPVGPRCSCGTWGSGTQSSVLH